MTKIGILALQGAFAEHEQVLKALGVETDVVEILVTLRDGSVVIMEGCNLWIFLLL